MTLQQRTEQQAVEQYRPDGYREQVEGVVIRESDLVLPFIGIVQPTSKEGTVGTFRRKDTGEEAQSLRVVTLAVQPDRSKFPAGGFDRDARPECWSDDDRVGSGRPRREDGEVIYAKFAGRDCATCEHRASFGGQENREAGKCLPAYLVAMFLPESYETVAIRLQGVNTKVVRVLGAATHVRKAVLRLTLEKQTAKGTYYTINASAERLLNEAEQYTANAEYEVFRGRMAEGIDEEPTQPQPAEVPQSTPNAQPAPQPQPAAQEQAQMESFKTFMPGDKLPF